MPHRFTETFVKGLQPPAKGARWEWDAELTGFLNHLYCGMDEPGLKIVDVFMCKLRKRLANASDGKNYIETVWGRGYVLREPSKDEEKISA
jgi:hypothetical protein